MLDFGILMSFGFWEFGFLSFRSLILEIYLDLGFCGFGILKPSTTFRISSFVNVPVMPQIIVYLKNVFLKNLYLKNLSLQKPVSEKPVSEKTCF